MQPVDIAPVPRAERRQGPADLFLIFAGANIVATTLQTGAALAPSFGTRTALALIVAGTLVGSALVAALVTVGPRLGVPSVVAARAAVGRRGASATALLLYVTNFAWIAVNNVIAGNVTAHVVGGDERAWSVIMGAAATIVVALGPRAVSRADRVAVPLMAVAGAILLARCVTLADAPAAPPAAGGLGVWRGLDVVVAYQVSWILMFADYSRYTASPSRSGIASFLALATTSLWFMPIGLFAARAAGSTDPGAMVQALGVGWAGAVVLVLGTLTTNFVNIYLSALAWKSLIPDVSPRLTVWATGAVGTGLGLLSRVWLERYEGFMLVLGTLLVPLGGVLLARFFALPVDEDPRPLYGPRPAPRAYVLAGLVAWAAGAAVYYTADRVGGTLPSVLAAGTLYWLLARSSRSPLRITRSDAPMSAATADQSEP